MASALDELLQDSRRQGFLAHAGKILRKRCSRALRQRMAVVYCGTPRAEENDILDTAVAELAGQLLEHADEVELLLIRLRQEEQNGEISPEDVWTRVLDKGFSYLQNALMDTERRQSPAKHLYKRLRECLSKSGKIARSRDGMAYGPLELPPESPVAPPDHATDFADLPEPESVPTDDVVTQNYLIPQALRFWNIYMRQRLNDIPHFLPIYILQGWLCRKYALLALSQQEGLYIEGEDGSLDLRTDPQLTSTHTPDIRFAEAELLERAHAFVQCLPDHLAALCALYYASDEARQEEVARALGFRSAAGLDRHKKNFERLLRDFMTEYADLLEQSPTGEQLAQDFLDAVYEACKKRYMASKKEAGGLHHE